MQLCQGTSAMAIQNEKILSDEDRAFLSAIQDPEKRRQVIEILLG